MKHFALNLPCAIAPLLATPAAATMAAALDLCLNTSLTLSQRSDAFETQGWITEHDTTLGLNIVQQAVTLSNISAIDHSTWRETQEWANTAANGLANQLQGSEIFLMTMPGAATLLMPNATGLQTCLYVGQDTSLAPVHAVLDGSILREIGDLTRIRGEGFKSLVSAHALAPDKVDQFDPPLSYNATFSVVLDRQPWESK